MALFGLNWEESKWPGHFCSIVLYFFASKIGVKLPPEKKVPWHRRGPGWSSGSNCHFCQKNAFFGQKKAFFQKVHFIQKCSVTLNTVFQYVQKNFFCSNPKLIFFTKFNLDILNIDLVAGDKRHITVLVWPELCLWLDRRIRNLARLASASVPGAWQMLPILSLSIATPTPYHPLTFAAENTNIARI